MGRANRAGAGAVVSSTVGEFFGGSMRRVRDEVLGDVPLDKAVRTLLETAVMARLKGMNALCLTSFAFPAAKHSRFDHSIGVYHLTRLTLKPILDSGAYLEDRDVRASLAAAILQDAGRYPYASAVEDIKLPGMLSHDELTRRQIEETEVADVLLTGWDLKPHNVFRLVAGGEPDGDVDGPERDTPGGGVPLRNLTPT